MQHRDLPALFGPVTLFLGLTLFSGFLLRLQFGAWSGGFGAGLDLYRAHSHLAYYGVLFPAAWVAIRPEGAWVPAGRWLPFYFFLCVVSFLGFLGAGYGPVAIAGSTGVLFFWIVFALKNATRWFARENGWLAGLPAAVVLCALLIPAVAVQTPKDPVLGRQLANLFLALLMFAVFLPAIVHKLTLWRPPAWLWLGLSIAAALDTSGLELGRASGWGSAAWGFLFAAVITRSAWKKDPIRIAWLLLALSMIGFGLGLIPKTHAMSIAGIHFIVLGPLLSGFLRDHWGWRISRFFSWFYPVALGVMLAAILGTEAGPQWILPAHRLAGAAGAALIFLLFFETWRRRHDGRHSPVTAVTSR